MFTRPDRKNPSTIASDQGFMVRDVAHPIDARDGWLKYEYSEGANRLLVKPFEVGPRYHCSLAIDPKEFDQWEGSSEILPREKQERMLRNFRDALEFHGEKTLVIGRDPMPAPDDPRRRLQDLMDRAMANPQGTPIKLTDLGLVGPSPHLSDGLPSGLAELRARTHPPLGS